MGEPRGHTSQDRHTRPPPFQPCPNSRPLLLLCPLRRPQCPDVTVTVLDISDARVQAWNSDQLPIYEPGLTDLVKACRGVNLFYSTDAKKHLAEADLIFVWCVQGEGGGRAGGARCW